MTFHTQAMVLCRLNKCYYICKTMNAINKQGIYSMLRLNYNRLCRPNWFMYTYKAVSSRVLAVTKSEEHFALV